MTEPEIKIEKFEGRTYAIVNFPEDACHLDYAKKEKLGVDELPERNLDRFVQLVVDIEHLNSEVDAMLRIAEVSLPAPRAEVVGSIHKEYVTDTYLIPSAWINVYGDEPPSDSIEELLDAPDQFNFTFTDMRVTTLEWNRGLEPVKSHLYLLCEFRDYSSEETTTLYVSVEDILKLLS